MTRPPVVHLLRQGEVLCGTALRLPQFTTQSTMRPEWATCPKCRERILLTLEPSSAAEKAIRRAWKDENAGTA